MSGELGRLFREIDGKNEWIKLYDKIRNDSAKACSKLTTKVAKSSQNIRLNRYRDVLPFDHSRVVLPSGSYINASHVRVEDAGRDYILTQGPLPDTAEHFWEMVWHQRSKAVIMLSKIVEKCQIKCHQYFPVDDDFPGNGHSANRRLIFGDFEVELVKETESKHFSVRNLSLAHSKDIFQLSQNREVLHYQFNTWPDFSVPQSTHDFLEFLYEIRKTGALTLNLYGPPVIHCSAGIGRSGTFIIVDAVLAMVARATDLSMIDLVKLITELRQYRMGLIQTHDQLRFCWKSVVDALEKEEWRPLLNAEYDVLSASSSSNSRLASRRSVPNMCTGSSSSLEDGEHNISTNCDVVDTSGGDSCSVTYRRRRIDDKNSTSELNSTFSIQKITGSELNSANTEPDFIVAGKQSLNSLDGSEGERQKSKRRKSCVSTMETEGVPLVEFADVAPSLRVSNTRNDSEIMGKFKRVPSQQDSEPLLR